MKEGHVLLEGDRCYQAGLSTPHVKDGMPVHVRMLPSVR